MSSAANTGAGIYATPYAANWGQTTTGPNGHQSSPTAGTSILVTAASGTRTAGAATSVNGVALAYGTTFSYINASNPSVACDGAGDVLVSWSEEDYVKAGDTPDWNVWAQWYVAGGTPLGKAFEVNATTKNAQRYSAVAMDAQGDFVVTWQSQGQDGSGYGVYAQRYEYAQESNILDPTVAPIAPIGGTNELDVLSFTAADVQFELKWNGKTTAKVHYAGKADKTFTDAVKAAMAGIGVDVTVSVIDSTDFGITFVGAQGSQKQTPISRD